MKKVFILTTFIVSCLVFVTTASAATLSISPSSKSVSVGDTFSVAVNLDTQGASIDGVDLTYLKYNPALLQVQDANTSAAGVQIAPGGLMPATLLNKVDNSLGRVSFSQVVTGGGKYKGSGTLATISFKAIANGNANVTFDYTPGSTVDSNVASNGTDILNAVTNGSYVIKGYSAPIKNTVTPPVTKDSVGNVKPPVQDTSVTEVPTVGSNDVANQPVTNQEPSRSFFGSLADIFNHIISRIVGGFSKIFLKS